MIGHDQFFPCLKIWAFLPWLFIFQVDESTLNESCVTFPHNGVFRNCGIDQVMKNLKENLEFDKEWKSFLDPLRYQTLPLLFLIPLNETFVPLKSHQLDLAMKFLVWKWSLTHGGQEGSRAALAGTPALISTFVLCHSDPTPIFEALR